MSPTDSIPKEQSSFSTEPSWTDPAAERAVLGVLVAEPTRLRGRLLLDPEAFSEPALRRLAELLVSLEPAAQSPAGLEQAIRATGDRSLVALFEELERVSASRLAPALASVEAKWRARRLREAAEQLARGESTEGEGEIEEQLVAAESYRSEEMRPTEGASVAFIETTPASLLLKRAFSELERRYAQLRELPGLATGLEGLDRLTGGLPEPGLTVLVGGLAQGKTALALQVALRAAGEDRRPTAYLSAEDPGVLMRRLFGSLAQVHPLRMRTGRILDSEWPRLATAADRLFRTPLEFLRPAADATDPLDATLRYGHERHADFLVVDGLDSLVDLHALPSALAALARHARARQIPVLAIIRSRDLRHANELVHLAADVADLVLTLSSAQASDAALHELRIASHRQGPTGLQLLAFQPDLVRFDEFAAVPTASSFVRRKAGPVSAAEEHPPEPPLPDEPPFPL